jgi:hypothetical protein
VRTEPRPRSGPNARSGLQVSYPKAVDVLAGWLRCFENFADPDVARRKAELVMAGALSDRQRVALHKRNTQQEEASHGG